VLRRVKNFRRYYHYYYQSSRKPTIVIRLSSVFCCQPNCLEFPARRSLGSRMYNRDFQTVSEDIFVHPVLVCPAHFYDNAAHCVWANSVVKNIIAAVQWLKAYSGDALHAVDGGCPSSTFNHHRIVIDCGQCNRSRLFCRAADRYIKRDNAYNETRWVAPPASSIFNYAEGLRPCSRARRRATGGTERALSWRFIHFSRVWTL